MRPTPAVLLTLALGLLAACGDDEPVADSSPRGSSGGDSVSAALRDPAGEQVGTAEISFGDDGATLVVEAAGLTPGFHGLHVHETGTCEPDSASPSDPAMTGDFLSAGGHLAEAGQPHGEHVGDLPQLLASEDGTATLTVTSDRLTADQVLDDDGSALMVHAGADNSGNIPERYAPDGPDEMTQATGDSGGRVACAVLLAG